MRSADNLSVEILQPTGAAMKPLRLILTGAILALVSACNPLTTTGPALHESGHAAHDSGVLMGSGS